MTIFAELSAGQVLARTAERWDLSGPLPVPHGDWLRCPVCGSAQVQARHWMFHRRPEPSTSPWRCDLRLKCTVCAALWAHGIAVPQAYWQRHGEHRQRVKVGWRRARRELGL